MILRKNSLFFGDKATNADDYTYSEGHFQGFPELRN